MKYGKRRLETGAKIRVLIVDDSVVIRRMVAHALEEDAQISVVGNAANGAVALRMISIAKPDVLTLDVNMPEMNGLEALREIRRLYPDLVVIMLSTLCERGAATTMEALQLGANDYVAKPSNGGSLEESLIRLREELAPKIKSFFLADPESSSPERSAAAQPQFARWQNKETLRSKVRCRAVVIGSSTGGPNALAEIVPMLPAKIDVPIFIVQHMPPVFTKLLASRLQNLTKLQVKEATHQMPVENGTIYIAPGDYHMRIVKNGSQTFLMLDQSAPENSCRPAVDVLFRSAAELYGGATVAVILTGMGQDGKRGVERLRSEGAYVIAQDAKSSVVWGMPGAVVQAGLADAVVDLKEIIPELQKHI
jgi:two-component system, chemotaxis family, protein-glutamate methylesterase/glutaminase